MKFRSELIAESKRVAETKARIKADLKTKQAAAEEKSCKEAEASCRRLMKSAAKAGKFYIEYECNEPIFGHLWTVFEGEGFKTTQHGDGVSRTTIGISWKE